MPAAQSGAGSRPTRSQAAGTTTIARTRLKAINTHATCGTVPPRWRRIWGSARVTIAESANTSAAVTASRGTAVRRTLTALPRSRRAESSAGAFALGILGTGRVGRGGEVSMPGGRADLDDLPAGGVEHFGVPVGGLLGLVARHAQSLRVVVGGRAAAGGGVRVVDLPDRGAAPRGAAVPVAVLHESPKRAAEEAPSAPHRDQLAARRMRVELTQPHRDVVVEPGDQVAGLRRGESDRSPRRRPAHRRRAAAHARS